GRRVWYIRPFGFLHKQAIQGKKVFRRQATPQDYEDFLSHAQKSGRAILRDDSGVGSALVF
ncbi:unnamed protein product, partial [Ascophyllum nodosum]